MTTILPFPARASTLGTEADDQVQAMRAMLRYLQREAGDGGLDLTAACIAHALRVLEHESRDRHPGDLSG